MGLSRWGDWGWSTNWPLSKLTVSSTASRLGLSNTPTSSAQDNLSYVSDQLAIIEAGYGPITVSSGYRAPAVNSAVGGSSTSQHMTGLGVDIVPSRGSNKDLAAWLYANRHLFPDLDQVIWYGYKGHTHVGFKYKYRGEFLYAPAAGVPMIPWAPSLSEMPARLAQSPVQTAAMGGALLAGAGAVWAIVGVTISLVVLWAYQRRSRR